MQRKINGLLPHAAILICNMYIVFFLIDRVNQAMNFIDNGLTKALLLLLCAFALRNALVLVGPELERGTRPRREGMGSRFRSPGIWLPLLNAVMCVITLFLLLGDLLWPGADIFLSDAVKLYLLVTSLLSAVCGAMLYARMRRRRRRRRWAR